MERGDVILDGLLKTVAALLLAALAVFELGAAGINQVQAREAARSSARAGAVALSDGAGAASVEAAIETAAAEHTGVVVAAVDVDATDVHVTVRRDPDFLVLDRIDPIASRLGAEVTASRSAD